MNAKAFIDAHGGPTAFAGKTGQKVATVCAWSSRGFIPRTAWPEVMAAFPHVTLDLLLKVEAARPKPKAKAA